MPTSLIFNGTFEVLAAHIATSAREFTPRDMPICDVSTAPTIHKLMLNSWSAEYALRITPVVNDEQYLQSSLHWTFPQAYYSVLFSARAFLAAFGVNLTNELQIARAIARKVTAGFYPHEIGFLAMGVPTMYMVLRTDNPVLTAFLKDTRHKQLEVAKKELQANPKTAFRDSRTGEVLNRFNPEQYKQLATEIGYTTFFNLLTRLRISSNNREIERFVESETDVLVFHKALVDIVTYINAVHERYLLESLGETRYLDMLNGLPTYLLESFVYERYRSLTQASVRHAA